MTKKMQKGGQKGTYSWFNNIDERCVPKPRGDLEAAGENGR